MKSNDTVAIGWLDPGHVDGMFCMSIASIYAERHSRMGGLLRIENGGLISRGRNELCTAFLTTTKSEWLLMIDSDEQLSLEGFDKLIGAAHDKDRPIVAGLYFGAWPGDPYPTAVPLIFYAVPNTTTFVPITDYPADRLIPVDSAGTGCLLIHRSVLEKFQETAAPHQGPKWCWFQDMAVNRDWFSEDHFFCSRALSLGFKIHAHTGVVLPHRKRFWVSDKHHVPQPTKLAAGPVETAEKKAVLESTAKKRPAGGVKVERR